MQKRHNRIVIHYADMIVIHHHLTYANFLYKGCSNQVLKILERYFMSHLRDKVVKTVVQPSASLPEHQLQPSSPFAASIMTTNIFYLK